MEYWLMKSEPSTWSWEQQVKAGAKGEGWDGVRNYQASNNMKKMAVGDLCFFYHSVKERDIVGIVKVIKICLILQRTMTSQFAWPAYPFARLDMPPMGSAKLYTCPNNTCSILQ